VCSSDLGGTIVDYLESDCELGVEEIAIGREAKHRLYRAMDEIEPIQRAILILRDVQGLDYKRIAEIMEIPEGTVKSRLFRARTALREQIERDAARRV